jgi:hypothetical protein
MSRILPRVGRVVLAVVAALTLSATVSGTAHAADAPAGAFLYRYLYLTDTPDSLNAPAQVDRSIYLAAGYYHFRFNVVKEKLSTALPGSFAGKDVYLPAGSYDWNCMIAPSYSEAYVDYCSLNLSNSSFEEIIGSVRWRVPTSGGSYYMQGWLIPYNLG